VFYWKSSTSLFPLLMKKGRHDTQPPECWDHRLEVSCWADPVTFEHCLLSFCESPVSSMRCDQR
ncbi:hypothetical protein STEG23_028851, partial [Scotinomys teguina]